MHQQWENLPFQFAVWSSGDRKDSAAVLRVA